MSERMPGQMPEHLRDLRIHDSAAEGSSESSKGLPVQASPPRREVLVVGALVWRAERLMITRRGPGRSMAGLWEFPGGKCEPGETEPEALARELREELHLDVTVDAHFMTVTHDYPSFRIQLSTWHCTLPAGEPVLTEHDAIAWVIPQQLLDYPMTAADVPLAQALAERKVY